MDFDYLSIRYLMIFGKILGEFISQDQLSFSHYIIVSNFLTYV